jgi:hypothetical protein
MLYRNRIHALGNERNVMAGEIEVKKLSDEQAMFKMTMKALGLQHELRIERDRTESWRKLANGYDDIRGWLRLCSDNPEGWQEFYKEACLIVFGSYGDDFADARDEEDENGSSS